VILVILILGSVAVVFRENTIVPNPTNFNATDCARQSLIHAQLRDADRQAQVQAALESADWVSLMACLQHWLRGQPGQPPLDWPQLADVDRAYLLDLAMHLVRWGDFQARWDVAKLMPIFGEAAIAPLLALLQSEHADPNRDLLNDDHHHLNPDRESDHEPVDPDAQWFAVRILGQLHPVQTMVPLITVLATTQNPDLQAMAVTVLAQVGATVIDPVVPLLTTPATRLLATQILAQIPHPQVISPLTAQVRDPDAAVRAAALEALARFQNDAIAPLLVAALQDPAAAVRRAAVAGLGFCPNSQQTDWVPHIQPLLLDLNIAVGRQAALTLGRLGTVAAVDALSQALKAPLLPPELGIDLVRSLVWSGIDDLGSVGDHRGIAQLGQALLTLPLAAAVLREGYAALGRVENPDRRPQAAAVLRELLSERPSAPQALQSTIVRALGQLGQPEAIPDLVQLLTSTDTGLRLHIVAALKSLDVDVTTVQRLAQAEPPTSALGQGLAAVLQEW
jgi:HEAT repeat protein